MSNAPPITRPLNIGHFPAPVLCTRCDHVAAFEVAGRFACTSQECDPDMNIWFTLDALFHALANQAKA